MSSDFLKSIGQNRVSTDPIQSMFQDLSRLGEILKSFGIEVEAVTSENLPYFAKLPAEVQSKIHLHLNTYIEAIIASYDKDIFVVQNQTMWRLMHKWNFKFKPDLFEILEQDSIIEIYSADGIQIYRSLEFFKFCSYTLEEIYSCPWFDLYGRPAEIETQSLNLFNKALSGEVSGHVRRPFNKYTISELHSRLKIVCEIDPLLISFLENKTGQLAGFLNSVRLLKSGFVGKAN